MKEISIIAIVCCLLALFVVTSDGDYKEEARQQVAYCREVKASMIPDYEGNYATECTADKLKELENILR